ncbi:EcsC family protein [Pradoshia sp.]
MSDSYEQRVKQDIAIWKKKLVAKPSRVERLSKNAQNFIGAKMPKKINQAFSLSIKTMVEGVLTGSSYVPKKLQSYSTLAEMDKAADSTLAAYRKTAIVEGAGTGFGGGVIALTDFPLLLSIKINYLYALSGIYGYNPKSLSERIFILLVFQLAFSSVEKKKELLPIILNWEKEKESYASIDWDGFQQEYRDTIDFVKMFQLIPGFGAAVGAIANHQLLDQLGETAQNAFRIRVMQEGGA